METSSAFSTSWDRIFTSCLYCNISNYIKKYPCIPVWCLFYSLVVFVIGYPRYPPLFMKRARGGCLIGGSELFMDYSDLWLSCLSASVRGWTGFSWFSPSLWYIKRWRIRWIIKYFSRLTFYLQNDLLYVILTWLAVYRNYCFRFPGVVVIKKKTCSRVQRCPVFHMTLYCWWAMIGIRYAPQATPRFLKTVQL
jgi:hypothetical protein